MSAPVHEPNCHGAEPPPCPPGVETILRDDESGKVYRVLAFRALSEAETRRVVAACLAQRHGRLPAGVEITVVTAIA